MYPNYPSLDSITCTFTFRILNVITIDINALDGRRAFLQNIQHLVQND